MISRKVVYQKIYDKNGEVIGIELLSRKTIPNLYTDIYFLKDNLELAESLIPYLPERVRIHINAYANTILNATNWDLESPLRERIIIEIVEQGKTQKVKEAVEVLKENGITFALDDFGKGISNFEILSLGFPIVKVANLCFFRKRRKDVREVSMLVEAFKEMVRVCSGETPFLISEAVIIKGFDGYQSFYLHVTESIDKIFSRQEKFEKILLPKRAVKGEVYEKDT